LNTSRNVLVCVTQQKTCERLIMTSSSISRELKCKLFVIHVAKDEWNFLDNIKEGEAIEYLFGISKSVGADLTILRSNDIIKTISDFIISNKIGYVVLGQSLENHQENNFADKLKTLLPNIEFKIIS